MNNEKRKEVHINHNLGTLPRRSDQFLFGRLCLDTQVYVRDGEQTLWTSYNELCKHEIRGRDILPWLLSWLEWSETSSKFLRYGLLVSRSTIISGVILIPEEGFTLNVFVDGKGEFRDVSHLYQEKRLKGEERGLLGQVFTKLNVSFEF